MNKTKNFIYWISLIGPLWDCVFGFVKGVYTVFKSGALVDEFDRVKAERKDLSLTNYINETKLKIFEDLGDE